MNAMRKAHMFGGMTLAAAAGLLVAAGSFAFGTSPVDPYGGTNSGAGRYLAGGLPTPADPSGPNSGVGRQVAGGLPTPADPSGPNSGVGRQLAGGWPTPTDPNGPNSGMGRNLA